MKWSQIFYKINVTFSDLESTISTEFLLIKLIKIFYPLLYEEFNFIYKNKNFIFFLICKFTLQVLETNTWKVVFSVKID